MNSITRSTLYAAVAAYMLYTGYDLFCNRADTNTTMTPVARWFFIALFALAGIGLIYLAWRTWKNRAKDDELNRRKKEKPENSADIK